MGDNGLVTNNEKMVLVIRTHALPTFQRVARHAGQVSPTSSTLLPYPAAPSPLGGRGAVERPDTTTHSW